MESSQLSEPEIKPVEALEKAGIPFIRLTHPAAYTMELCRGIGAEYGARHCKNLFLANKHGTRFFLYLTDPDKPYRTSEVSRRLGSTRLSFGAAEQLSLVLGARQGAVSVMALTNECAKENNRKGVLTVAVDEAILSWERLCVHPNTDTATLVITPKDLIRFLEYYGIGYVIVGS